MEDFVFKPFEEMTAADYEKIGFKSGLEVHQQLLTENKLFCRCPAGLYSHEYHAEILRHMRPTLSELGEYDGTALMEFKTKKDIIYRINRASVCTYEMDDTPPFLMNLDALDKGIAIGLLSNCNVVDELHIARKQYLDGSIPTGFQRTAIFCVDGHIPYKDREISILQMSLEEDSCREISDWGHKRIYNTDRLGMPLIETVTGPDMRTPDEVAEVNQIIRRIARSSGRVRTGLGAGREDVNVSVTGGTRIEIKGVPNIVSIPLLTYNEAMRQWNLLRLREELKRRGITADTFETQVEDITKLVKKVNYEPLRNAIQNNKIVRCITLKGFKGLLTWQTQTDTVFAKEISDRLRVIACLSGLPNMIHSDSPEYTLSSLVGQKIRKHVGAGPDDTMVIVWADDYDIETATKEIIIRAKEATIGIPSETRQAWKDGTNGFERILPGPDRMYPDTDSPPIPITAERVNRIKQSLPEKIWINEKWYRELNLPEDLIVPLYISKFSEIFSKAVKEINIDPKIAATVLIQYPKRLKRKGLDTSKLDNTFFEKLFNLLAQGKIVKDALTIVMANYITNGDAALEEYPTPANENEIIEVFKALSEELKTENLYNPDKIKELIIGTIMTSLRGRCDGQFVTEFVNNNFNGVN